MTSQRLVGAFLPSFLTTGLSPQVTLKLQESQLPGPEQLQQFQVVCGTEEDKFLLLYALLKLSLIRGKSLLFVNTLERSYRLRLFLEQFSIPACVLNGELPLRSRCAVMSRLEHVEDGDWEGDTMGVPVF